MRNVRQFGRAGIVALSLGLIACRSDAPTAPLVVWRTPAATIPQGSTGDIELPEECRDCLVGPVTFVRDQGAPQSTTVTFSAIRGKPYVVDLDDLGSQGAIAHVTLNDVALLARNGTGKASAQHYQGKVILEELNTLVIRLEGKPGSSLRVAIWLYKPVTLDAVTLALGATLEIGRASVGFSSTITNHTTEAVAGASVQTTVTQISASRAAGETILFCGEALGWLPPGTCRFDGGILAPRNGAAGTGSLTAGPALAIVRLRDGAANVLDSLIVPVVLTGPAIAAVAVLPPSVVLEVSRTTQLTATVFDFEGLALNDRTVTWTSSDTRVATVDALGKVVGVVAGGPITITARSEGTIGSATVIVTPYRIVTGIADIRSFLERCPTNDPAYAQIRQDFELRVDGQPSTVQLACSEPFSAMPIEQLTDELIAEQVLRTAYYMSKGTEGKLPWTPKAMYTWLSSNVHGVNLKTAPGQLYCCDLIDGKLYISTSRQDAFQRDFKRTWPGIASSLNFYAHEIRHADPGAPGHTTGCEAFPLPTDPPGCDATYTLSNLGSYGVQYWLESNWATGTLHIGIGCAPADVARQFVAWHEGSVNSFRSRFVSNVPPPVSPVPPYGGPCLLV